ncbi:Tol-Pal system beta propeller repeat protein TolB [Sphingomonas sp.]|uniref:Tol-Pal system beta propeller repeat protein TolB n=1 Tax=Sphingomonas sp. TaxID=28214 RepID=UPI002E347FFC|nr:Tol-Pal system beta propeller repeat protein TolB [Sphingomonas sp.]HEX4692956.1 Tol-Pal system beta propeller repeat protein TolB [Sphingomonas sp.]
MRSLLSTSIAALAIAAVPAVGQVAPAPAPAAPQSEDPIVDVIGGISQPMGIAIPPLPTPESVSTPAGSTDELGRQLAQVITNDLRNSGLFKPLPAGQLLAVPFAEATSPNYAGWSTAGATALVQGYVRANGDGTMTVGCYLYDIVQQREMARQGYIVPFAEWRRAAHKCADMVYTKLTGEGPYFDSRVVYVSETGPKARRVKRLALMDQDGFNGRFLTNGQTIVLTPTLSRDQRKIAYLSYLDKKPTIYVYDIAAGTQRKLVSDVSLAFAPRFSPDGRWILFSMATNGSTNLYRIPSGGGQWQKLTSSPGIDTGGSYSPDGSKIVFESDRSGAQQLYVMNADGSNQQRISFGNGRYATPAWSPRGDLIAFTKIGGGFHVGIMSPSGGGEKMLTDGWQDEAPSWSPNGRVIMFFRSTEGGSGVADLWSVDLTGVNERRLPTPFDGSDPNWGPIRTD